MDSISTSAAVIGIISFSFEYAKVVYVEKERSNGRKGLPLSALVSSIEKLCDILQILKSDPEMAMSQPVEVQTAAKACASDMLKLENLIRKQQERLPRLPLKKTSRHLVKLTLRVEHVEEMQSILQTHIDALTPFAHMHLGICQLEEPQYLIPGETPEEEGSANYINSFDSPLRYEHARNILAGGDQGQLAGRVTALMQCLEDGAVEFSRPQLYQLLCLLREIDGIGGDYIRNDWGYRKKKKKKVEEDDAAYNRFEWQVYRCLRRLSSLKVTRPTVRPSSQARETIAILKRFILEVKTLSNQRRQTRSLFRKRKAIAEERESNIANSAGTLYNFKRARRMSVYFQVHFDKLSPWELSHRGAKNAGPGWVECGRLAKEDGLAIPLYSA